MSQTLINRSVTYETREAVLATENETVTLQNARIMIEPLEHRHVSPAEKLAEFLCKGFVVSAAFYFAAELLHAWTSGAFDRLVAR